MADHVSETLPRLADALLDLGTRLGEIGTELHSLRLPGTSTAEPDAGPAAVPAPFRSPEPSDPALSHAPSPSGAASTAPAAGASTPGAPAPAHAASAPGHPTAGHPTTDAPVPPSPAADGAPGSPTPGHAASGVPAPEAPTSAHSPSGSGAPIDPSSGSPRPGAPASRSAAPGTPAGDPAMPGHPTSGSATPGSVTPGSVAADPAMPSHPTSGPATSGSAVPGPTTAGPTAGPATPRHPMHGYPGFGSPWQPGPFGAPPPQPVHWHRPPPPPVPSLRDRLVQDGAGSRILAWAGGVVTLAGVVLLLILAIQRGYLGPLPRVLLGAGLGLTLAGIGAVLHRSPAARTGAYALAATGVAVLYLDVVAATSLYHFLPSWGGLVAGLAVTAGGVAVAGRWGSQLFAVFVVVCCAVSAPILTGGFDTVLLSFLLVLLAGTTPVQLAKRWGGLLLAAGLPPVVACAIGISVAEGAGGDATLTAVLAGLTSALVIGLATATALRRPGDGYALVTLYVAPVPGMLAALLLPRLGATLLPTAVAVLLVAVWLLGRHTRLPHVFALSAGGLGALAFLQATATAFDGDARAIAFLAEALVVAVLAVRLRLAPALLPSAVFGFIGFLLALAYPARPSVVTRPPRWSHGTGEVVALGLTGVVLAAAAMVLCWAAFRLRVVSDEYAPHGWIPAGLVALYGSTAALLSVGLLLSPDRDGFLLGHVLVTVSWTVGALVLLLRGIDSVPLRVSGLSLVVAALAKLVLFDLSSLDGMARVAAFLVAGLVLLGAGARYAKLVAARNPARPDVTAPDTRPRSSV